MITVEVCPLNDEEILPAIIDDVNRQFNTEHLTATFRNTLLACAGINKSFDRVEDMFAEIAATIQRETVKRIHCPSCRNYDTCSNQ